jgi:hypothetical protein
MATSKNLQNEAIDLTFKDVKVRANKMAAQYRMARKDIEKKLSNLYKLMKSQDISPEGYANFMFKSRRLQALHEEIEKIYTPYLNEVNREIERASRISISNQYYRNQYATSWFSPVATPSTIMDFTLIDPVAVEMSVYNTPHVWKQIKDFERKKLLQPLLPKPDREGVTLRRLLLKNEKKALKWINQTITQGIIQGHSFATMSQAVRGSVNMSARNSLRIVRTETVRNSNTADFLTKQDAQKQGVEGSRRWLAVLDTRTRSQSASMDGQLEDPNGMFHYPNGATSQFPGGSGVARYDINERCTTVHEINGVGPLLRRGRNPVTGKNEVTDFESFNDWAKRNGVQKNKWGEMVGKKSNKINK